MAKKNDSWGVEVGSFAIKAMHLVRSGGEVRVADYAILPYKQVLTAPDVKVEQVIQSSLDKMLSRFDMTRSTVVVSVPGNAAFAKFSKLPPVDPKKIPDIVKFEAMQQIPFPIDQVEWDFQVFSHKDSPDVEIGIFAITKERVLKLLSNYEAVGLGVDGMTLSALAVYNALAYDLQLTEDSPGLMIMDVGTTTTDVVIVEAGNLWLRTLAIGGNSFTEALMRSFKLSFSKAEKLKREAETSKYKRQIFQAMRPVFADFVQELHKTLGFYMSLNREAQLSRLVGLGSTFRLPGLQKFLRQQVQVEVARLEGFQRVAVEGKRAADFASHALELGAAYGLALQGLGLERVSANILPTHIRKQRMWKSKQPWIAIAAGLILASAILAAIRLVAQEKSFESAKSVNEPLVTAAISKAQRYKNEWDRIAQNDDPRQKIEHLRRILDYRDVWPKVLGDVAGAFGAVGPQEELLNNDYEAIRAIPRRERRRLYVQSVAASYVFDSNLAGLSEEKLWDGKNQPPAFQITVKGTTPLRDPALLIGRTCIQWLKDRADQADRPYRIVPESIVIKEINTVEAASSRAAARTTTYAGKVGDLDRALPTRPLDEESRVDDSVFEVQWKIELRKPEDARAEPEAQDRASDADGAEGDKR